MNSVSANAISRLIILACMFGLWLASLSLYILWRTCGKPEDFR